VTAAARRSIVAVVGMVREARILAGAPAVVAGLGAGRLQARLGIAAVGDVAGVISFGLCGALDPSLAVGDLVVGARVTGGDGDCETDPDWARRIMRALPRARTGGLASADRPVASPAEKAALRAATGAAAVDMESAAASRAARALGVPFAILRAVSDAADRALPAAARVGLGPDGRPDVAAVLRALAARPQQLGALVTTALEAEAAFRALVRARHLLGPGLAGPDLGEPPIDVV